MDLPGRARRDEQESVAKPPSTASVRFPKRCRRGRSGLGVALAPLLMGLVSGCFSAGAQTRNCPAPSEILGASQASNVIAVAPRTSAGAATWGLREMAHLLPLIARSGLNLHMFYTEDGDDLGDSGGDGGPPQVLEAQAPSFPALQVPDAPQAPTNPNALSAKLYCAHLAAWENRASQVLRAERKRRATAVQAWARTVAVRLLALAKKPTSDTTGPEANVEFDAGASVFAAAQVASIAPQPGVIFLGGLTALAPPSQSFSFPAHLVVLVRSTNPTRVLHAERVWSAWTTRAGGAFKAVSANSAPAVIAEALVGWMK